MPTRRALVAFSAALAAAAPSSGKAASWPERPLRWIVGFPAGGAPDLLTRILAQRLEAELGQPTEINQGLAMETPLVVRIRKGSGSANYLGAKDGPMGHILLRTTHPSVPELKIAVRLAVEGV